MPIWSRRAIAMAAASLLAAACQQQPAGAGNETGGPAGAMPANQSAAAAPAEGAKGTLLDTVSKSAEHRTLANLINAAGLTETFSGSQPYTLFAPTEAAFQKLPAGTVNGLLAPEAKGQLVALLTDHVVPGVVTAPDLDRAIERGKGKAQLATVGGSTLTFTRSGDAVRVSSGSAVQATLGRSDLLQSNGVVHSIDAVLGQQ